MKSFLMFVNEAVGDVSANRHNAVYGLAYETGTALHLHNTTSSRFNKLPQHVDRIKEIQSKHDKAVKVLRSNKSSAHLADKAITAGKKSADAYRKSLSSNHNVNPEKDIDEVHHTPNGIGHLVSKPRSRADNPHDIAVKLKRKVKFEGHDEPSDVHGASLKATEGTASNTSTNAFDKKSQKHGVATKVHGIFNKAMSKIGLSDPNKEARKKLIAKAPNKFRDGYQAAQKIAAKHISKAYNTARLPSQKNHLTDMLRLKPDVPMDKVNGEKGTSVPTSKSPHLQAIKKAKNLTAVHAANGRVDYHDHEGAHIATSDIRTTHSGYTAPQNNYKLGTLSLAKYGRGIKGTGMSTKIAAGIRKKLGLRLKKDDNFAYDDK
jgi:hypothetical protein